MKSNYKVLNKMYKELLILMFLILILILKKINMCCNNMDISSLIFFF